MFKIGDRVKIKGNPKHYTSLIDGRIGTIVEIYNFDALDLAVVVGDLDCCVNIPWYVSSKDVTLVEV